MTRNATDACAPVGPAACTVRDLVRVDREPRGGAVRGAGRHAPSCTVAIGEDIQLLASQIAPVGLKGLQMETGDR